MNRETLEEVFELLGCETLDGADWIAVTCPYADQNHTSGVDIRPSAGASIEPDTMSYFKCHSASCGISGPLVNILSSLFAKVALDKRERYREIIMGEFSKAPKNTVRKKSYLNKVDAIPEEEANKYLDLIPNYIIKRGLSVQECKSWGIGWDGFQKRVVFTVRTAEGKLAGFVGRAILPNIEPRYRTYKGLRKSQILYAEHLIRESFYGDKSVVLVEGALDAIFLHRHEIPAVASLGAAVSRGQAQRLINLAKEGRTVYIIFDGDDGGRRSAFRAAHRILSLSDDSLRSKMFLRLVPVPTGLDPKDLSKEELGTLMENAAIVISSDNDNLAIIMNNTSEIISEDEWANYEPVIEIEEESNVTA